MVGIILDVLWICCFFLWLVFKSILQMLHNMDSLTEKFFLKNFYMACIVSCFKKTLIINKYNILKGLFLGVWVFICCFRRCSINSNY